jgi:hypothetical protein
MIKAWQDLGPETQRNALVFLGVAAALGPVLIALGTLVAVLGVLLSPLGLIVVALAAMSAAWITNAGDIQGKVLPAWDALIEKAPLLLEAMSRSPFQQQLNRWGQDIERFLGLVIAFWDLLIAVFQKGGQTLGNIFAPLGPIFAQFGEWLNKSVWQPILDFFSWLGGIIDQAGIRNQFLDMARSGEMALSGQAAAIRNGGALDQTVGGGAPSNNITVAINNPVVPDQTIAEQFAQQVQDVLVKVLIESERQADVPAAPGLPGQPFHIQRASAFGA